MSSIVTTQINCQPNDERRVLQSHNNSNADTCTTNLKDSSPGRLGSVLPENGIFARGKYCVNDEADTSEDDASDHDASKDDASKDDASKDDASKDDASKDDASKDNISKTNISQDDAFDTASAGTILEDEDEIIDEDDVEHQRKWAQFCQNLESTREKLRNKESQTNNFSSGEHAGTENARLVRVNAPGL